MGSYCRDHQFPKRMIIHLGLSPVVQQRLSLAAPSFVYLQALCLDSPSKHWELLIEEGGERPIGFHVPKSL